MAVDIVVSRDPGDKSGQDIVDGLLSDLEVAILAGTTAIDDDEPSIAVTLSANYRIGVRNGDIIEVIDNLQGQTWRGRVVGVVHTVRLADIWTDLEVEKPLRYCCSG